MQDRPDIFWKKKMPFLLTDSKIFSFVEVTVIWRPNFRTLPELITVRGDDGGGDVVLRGWDLNGDL